MTHEERAETLEEAADMLYTLTEMIKDAVRDTDLADRAEAYLISALEMAKDDEHIWLGRNQCTLQSLIDALANGEEHDDEDY